ncbi:F-box/RNI/FBD-like domain protein [Medicago truncatula]|uniref:F-box/RNI/FBD-like domain protein n=1 Tax=Medicago truncatula TaxID=3880 RepID=G7I7L5_MEDTR|nr:F-box/RNI/FBD-like domain protein [Medicago truncatula]
MRTNHYQKFIITFFFSGTTRLVKGRKLPKCLKMIDVESDIISCLPDHLIELILSHLSIKEAVRTSVLSSNWRKKWSTLPDLVFDRECVSTETSKHPSVIESKFLRIVDHVLLLHSGPINKFEVSDSNQYFTIGVNSMADIDQWIFQISKRYIKEFVLDIRLKPRYKIPCCLFSCQSLQHLELNYCCLNPPTTFEGFRNLKSLSLFEVTMTQDAFENMICGCPLLEELTLYKIDGLWLKPPTTFEGFRNLKSLSLSKVRMTQDAFENMISGCPLLEELTLNEIDGLWIKPPTTFEGFRNLKSLSLSVVRMTQDAFENMISGCPLLEELALDKIDGLWLKAPTTFEGFRNLKSLSLFKVRMTQDAFENMISGCPLLEELTLNRN